MRENSQTKGEKPRERKGQRSREREGGEPERGTWGVGDNITQEGGRQRPRERKRTEKTKERRQEGRKDGEGEGRGGNPGRGWRWVSEAISSLSPGPPFPSLFT